MFIISQSGCPWQSFPAKSNFVSKTRSLPQSGIPDRGLTQVDSSLICKYYTSLKWLARDKHSSLLRTFVIYSRKKFYNICLDSIGQGKKIFSTLKSHLLGASIINLFWHSILLNIVASQWCACYFYPSTILAWEEPTLEFGRLEPSDQGGSSWQWLTRQLTAPLVYCTRISIDIWHLTIKEILFN